ncbi:MAG: hypothetical protein PGN26_02435 [Xylophilus ampelinus]
MTPSRPIARSETSFAEGPTRAALRQASLLLCASLGLLGATLVLAADPGASSAGPDARATYQSERARCEAGRSGQDLATCLREAGAAQDENRRGNLARQDPAREQANRASRCDAQPAANRAECEKRLSRGTVEGSVQGGGILREVETTVPAPAASR